MSQIIIKQKNSSLSIKMDNLGFTGVSFVYCTKLCVLRKLNYRTQTISPIWIPFLSLRISLQLFLQFYRRRWERSIGLCHRVKNKISQKDVKCIPSCETAGIVTVFCAGESFGVLRLGTSPQISFSNDNLIKQFTTWRLAISQNISQNKLWHFVITLVALCNKFEMDVRGTSKPYNKYHHRQQQ